MKNELYHYGVSGQKWGVRRYQNGDGSYTSEGKKRYKKSSSSKSKKKAIVIGAAAVGTALAVCGAYKLAKSGKLNGLVEMGKRFVQDMNYVELDNSDRTANRKRMADYDRWAKVNDARIRNHGRL